MTILHDEGDIRTNVAALAARINADYADRELDLVVLLNGANMFGHDLARHLTMPTRLHHLGFTSYQGAPQSGEVCVTLDIAEPLQGRHVLIAEGIVISGRTPLYLVNLLKLRDPASIALCAVGTKPAMRSVDLDMPYSMYSFGKEMVAGYGIGKGPERLLPHLIDTAAR